MEKSAQSPKPLKSLGSGRKPLNLELEYEIFCYFARACFFKNVSKRPAFSRPTQILTLKYGLDDAMWIKKKELVLIEYSFTPSVMNFQTIWMS